MKSSKPRATIVGQFYFSFILMAERVVEKRQLIHYLVKLYPTIKISALNLFAKIPTILSTQYFDA